MLSIRRSIGDPLASHVERARDARSRALHALLTGGAGRLGGITRAAGRGAVRALRSIVAGVVLAQRRRAAIRELAALDDRLLKDIGLSRSEIPFVVDAQLAAERSARMTGAGSGAIARLPGRDAAVARCRAPLREAA